MADTYTGELVVKEKIEPPPTKDFVVAIGSSIFSGIAMLGLSLLKK